MAKKMIIKGVGSFMAKRYAADGEGVEVISLGTLQDLRIDLNVELEDIFGGDGLFAIDTLVTTKSIEITATDAKFDLDAVQLMMGSTVQDQVADFVWVLGEQRTLVAGTIGSAPTVNVASGDVAYKSTIWNDGNFTVRLKDSNKLLVLTPFTALTAPTVTQFYVDSTTVPGEVSLIFNTAHVGKDIVFNYQREEIVDLVDIMTDEVPFPVHVIHHGSFLQKDGVYAGVETELYMCRSKGTLSIDAQRSTASASQVALQVLDPERADGKLGTIKRFSSATKA